MTTTTLKPCPACGRAPTTAMLWGIIVLVACECGFTVDSSGEGSDASIAWNTRPIEDALRKERDEACANLDEAREHIAKLKGLLREFVDGQEECCHCRGSCVDPEDHKRRSRCSACAGIGTLLYDDDADTNHGLLVRVRAALAKGGE